jgi:putative glycosyltransferase (TIGR04372 family)
MLKLALVDNYILRRAAILFAFLPFSILVAISSIIRVRVARLPSARFGHAIMNSEIYLCSVARGKKNFTFPLYVDLVFLMGDLIPNQALDRIIRRSLPIYSSYLVYPLWVWATRFRCEAMRIPEIDQMMSDNQNYIATNPCQLKLVEAEVELAKYELTSVGMDVDKPWVCLFARSSRYLMKHYPAYRVFAHLDNHRNSDPSVFNQTVTELIHSGYKVVFMGLDSGYNYDSFKNTLGNRILVREEVRISDVTDLYLGSRCDFFLSTPSGAENSADIFGRRPLLNFDMITLAHQAVFSPMKISIFKLQFSLKLGRFLRLEEIKQIGSHRFLHSNQFSDAGIDLISNSGDDIRDLVREFFLLRDNNWDRSFLPSKGSLSLEFNRIIGLDVPPGYPPAAPGRVIRIAERFLEKHYDILF